MKTVTLIYNPIAGGRPARREAQIQRAAGALRESGVMVRLARTSTSGGPGSAAQLARAAAAEGTILVCGGDGTINEVVNGMLPGNTALGILPGGTANILAKELRLPHDPVRAARAFASWRPRRISLGVARWPVAAPGIDEGAQSARTAPAPSSRYFVSVAGIGLDARIVRKFSAESRPSPGIAGLAWGAIREVWRYPFAAIRCRLDGRTLEGGFVIIQRTRRYAGWLHLAPEASIFDGKLRLCLFKGRRPARYFLYAAAVAARVHRRLRDVEMAEFSEMSCEAQEPGQPIDFELDGEWAGQLPASFEILPEALTLLVP